jgi:hypothetical protein
MIPVIMGLEILIVANYVTLSNVVGATIALVIWFGALRRLRRPEILLASIMELSTPYSPPTATRYPLSLQRRYPG